jgi:hypothetical protein
VKSGRVTKGTPKKNGSPIKQEVLLDEGIFGGSEDGIAMDEQYVDEV